MLLLRRIRPPGLRLPRVRLPHLGPDKTLRFVAQYADACNIFGEEPEVIEHKLSVLRGHCDDAGRDYDSIEKTTAFAIDPGSTADDIVREASAMRELGFTVAYVYAHDITDRRAITDLFAAAVPALV